MDALARCMEEAGWINESEVPGEVAHTFSEAQEQVYWEARYQCIAQYPLKPKYYQRFNDAQLRARYAHHVGPLSECLAAEGYPPPEPPSLEKYIADYRGDVNPRWFPYSNVAEHDYHRVEEACPLEPEGFYDLATVPDG